jgi:hypothetical protein
MKHGKTVKRERPFDAGVFKRAWMEVRSREEDSSMCLGRGENVDDHVDG